MHPDVSFSAAAAGRRLLLALTLGATLGGCAALQPMFPATAAPGVISGSQSGTPLDAALGTFLAQAPEGSVLAVAASPWGSHVEVTAQEAYLSASGRECRKLRVARAGAGHTSAELACNTAQGWQTHRLVTEVIAVGAQR
ncbi:DVU3141 family protein [Thauera sp.]|uniref:DVU3141 family protein n=1 Tax=Thauera sp. TaxID=1905334 RepID=UPI002A370E00|nr:DVU3141 family protein [Thauera sp.]MDX9886288.1 DVU3141 family protein [Thauera sp.]